MVESTRDTSKTNMDSFNRSSQNSEINNLAESKWSTAQPTLNQGSSASGQSTPKAQVKKKVGEFFYYIKDIICESKHGEIYKCYKTTDKELKNPYAVKVLVAKNVN